MPKEVDVMAEDVVEVIGVIAVMTEDEEMTDGTAKAKAIGMVAMIVEDATTTLDMTGTETKVVAALEAIAEMDTEVVAVTAAMMNGRVPTSVKFLTSTNARICSYRSMCKCRL
mmetsp:Transcript_65973/g.102961  ORF Transcript_65973/g.102961 Transcript_65973/m.102961 type:complete len:113 (+) Transcript_65973:301-639(+)